MKIQSFIDNEFKEFSKYDNVRSIPSIIDGLKTSQRKAVYAIIKHGTKSIKVSQFGSYASMVSSYHHGEVSMCETISILAQDFTGSNNINLFEPEGQFGSRLSNSSASHRYIFTKQSNLLREIYKQDDDCILKSLYDDGQEIEPKNYYPILPMALINGAKGIGTGHATNFFSYNPKEIIDYISSSLKSKKSLPNLLPYFDGYDGSVIENTDGQLTISGSFERINTTTIKITELPINFDLDGYKSVLIDLLNDDVIKDYDNNSTESNFEFTVYCPRLLLKKTDKELTKIFKLERKFTQNFTLWNEHNELVRYENVYQILDEFIEIRLEKYKERINKQIIIIKNDILKLESKLSFIVYWSEHDIKSKTKQDIIKESESIDKVLKCEISSHITIPIYSFTLDEVKKLRVNITKKEILLSKLISDEPKSTYLKELFNLNKLL